MNILLIGNGFDLEHGLPTSYTDFLIFCKKAKLIYTYTLEATAQDFCDNVLSCWEVNSFVKQCMIDAFNSRLLHEELISTSEFDTGIRTSNKELDELYSYTKNNIWLKYFWNLDQHFGKNWIDFELEISRVIKAFDAAKNEIVCGRNVANVANTHSNVLNAISKHSNISLSKIFYDTATIEWFVEFLNSELLELIRCLEIYLAGFVSKIPIQRKSDDIESICPDHILSFNYTSTYERVYGLDQNIEYDYIHGKADIDRNTFSCNMVLGIDEYLDDPQRATDLEFLPFKKYYQRIYKSTGNRYLDWVDKIKYEYAEYLRKVNVAYSGTPDPIQSFPRQKRYYSLSSISCPQHTLYIFGHSLDVTDKDVLKLLICNDNIQTKIFYYRKNSDDKTILGKLIKNLVKILGPDELIRRTGGTHKTIEFIPQSLHED